MFVEKQMTQAIMEISPSGELESQFKPTRDANKETEDELAVPVTLSPALAQLQSSVHHSIFPDAPL